MRKIVLCSLILLCAWFCPAWSEQGQVNDEVEAIDNLIKATEQKLEVEKQLKTLMIKFNQQQDEFFKGNQTKHHAFRMVSTAREIMEIVSNNHLKHLFSKEYLDELVLFSSIAGKSSPVRP